MAPLNISKQWGKAVTKKMQVDKFISYEEGGILYV